MLRVISETKPEWVIGENVSGLLSLQNGMVFEQVCTDLENEGYEVQPFVIPACAVGAPHRRDRVWIVANATGKRCDNRADNREERQVLSDQNRHATKNKPERKRRKCGVGETDTNVTNPGQQHGESWRKQGMETNKGKRATCANDHERQGEIDWSKDWIEVATELCSVDDGFPAQMGGTTISKARHRREQLKAYGNAIVPQVAIKIFEGIKAIFLLKD